VWNYSISLVKEVYKITNSFPSKETYRLVDQLRRAIISIPANIAEGCSKTSAIDKSRYMKISLGSINECITYIIVSKEIGYINQETAEKYEAQLIIIKKKLINLIKSIEGKR